MTNASLIKIGFIVLLLVTAIAFVFGKPRFKPVNETAISMSHIG